MTDQPIRNQFIYELPEVPYDIPQLRSIMHDIAPTTFDSLAVDPEIHQGWKYEDARADDWLAIPHVLQLCEMFNPHTTDITDIVFNWIRPNGQSNLHTDYLRNGALMFIVTPDYPAAPIYWEDGNGNRIYEHCYRMPTLIQTKVLHGVFNDARLRVSFQISFKQVFEELIELHKHDQLFSQQWYDSRNGSNQP